MRLLPSLAGIFLAAAMIALLACPVARAGELVPHRAVYTMRLASAQSSGGLTGIRGAMVYEFRDVCDAWTVDAKFYLLMQYGRNKEVESVRKTLTWEAKNGQAFRFSVEELRNKRMVQAIRGVAALDGKGLGGVAKYSKPRKIKVDLPPGTVFPTAHMVKLIHRSVAGKPILGKVLFDGATLDNPYEVNAVIGKYQSEERRRPGPLKATDGKAIWSARLAFFPFYSKAETAEFDLVVDFREDGVVDRMLQDFGDYSLEALMNQIEFLPKAVC